MKSSASMWESSGSQFFRTTTRIQSGQDAFDKLRLIMTFLIIVGVTEICSFRLVIEGKTGKKITESSRLEFLEKFSAILLYQMQKTTPLGCWIEEFSRFTFFENTISNSPKVLRAKFLEKDGLFCFISICKFHSFKNLFATVASLSEL